jgi:hypothetical protein
LMPRMLFAKRRRVELVHCVAHSATV